MRDNEISFFGFTSFDKRKQTQDGSIEMPQTVHGSDINTVVKDGQDAGA